MVENTVELVSFASSMISAILEINESHSSLAKKSGSIRTPFSSNEFFCSLVNASISFRSGLVDKFVRSQQAFVNAERKI